MKLSPGRREEPELNITSLIDVVFLLLIFFMVTTTFVQEAGLDLRLPDASANAAESADEAIVVVVDASDAIYVEGKPLTVFDDALSDALSDALAVAADGNISRPLRIKADGRASHQAVVSVMDTAAELGFSRVDIATQAAGEDN